MTPYGEIIHEHSRHPRNYGSLDSPDLRCEGHNPFCGDRVRVELSLTNDIVSAARFQGDLCVIAKAASSVLTEMIGGLPLSTVANLPDQQLLDALGAEIQPARRKCALLALEILQSGIKESGR